MSSILTGGSSSSAPLTWVLFFGVPIGFIIYSVSKRDRNKSNSNQEDNAEKVNHQAIEKEGESVSEISIKPIASRETTHLNSTRLQKKIAVYNSLFKECKTVDDIIKAYIDYNGSDILLNAVEVEILRYYLQFNSKFKNQTWTSSKLISMIKSEVESYRVVSSDISIDNIFTTVITDEKTQKSQYKSEPIKKTDNIKKSCVIQFNKMRKIIGNDSYFVCREDTFTEQGKFMENFTDDYEGNAYFQEYYPTYNSMNDEQLRTYFTWRTKTRNGELTKTYLSYVFVYIYELINNIGVKSPSDGIEKLIWLLKNYATLEQKVENYLVDWIKEYYICNQFDISFKEIITKFCLESYYPEIAIDVNSNKYSFDTLCGISKYKIEDSNFLNEENKRYIVHCFDKSICNLTPLLILYGTDFDELVIGTNELQYWWRPFNGAVYKNKNNKDKKVIISKNEIYIMQNGVWKVNKPSQYSNVAPLVFGYIIKRIEANLRILTNYRHNLSPNINTLLKNICSPYGYPKKIISVISDISFDEIIDETTKNEFLALSDGNLNSKLPKICVMLNNLLSKEPYMTFIKMRNCIDLKGETDQTRRFNIQAKIFTDLTDNYETTVPFDSLMPIYENMSNEQLRCYFTCRTKVLTGEYLEIPESYVRLYTFELINKIRESDADIVLSKLALILKQYSHLGKSFETFIKTCIKDYYICEDIQASFYDIIKKHSIEEYYPNITVDYETNPDLHIFRYVSNYNITKSKFYNEQTKPIINECFDYVFAEIKKYFVSKNLNINKIIIGIGYRKNWWQPFKNAYCNIIPKSNKRVVLCSNEIYSFKKDEWTCELMPEKDSTGSILIGYIIKRTEVKMREILKYKYKLSADVSTITKRLINHLVKTAVEDPRFSQTIDNAVENFFKEKYPQVFTNPNAPIEEPVKVIIDKSKLDKIRQDAEHIRDKLTVEDVDVADTPSVSSPVIVNEKEQSDNPIDEFCSMVNDIQKEAITIILNEPLSMPSLIKLSVKHKIMTEVLLDSINELSIDIIGDNIIETSEENPFIYDEYVNAIKKHLEEKQNGKNST